MNDDTSVAPEWTDTKGAALFTNIPVNTLRYWRRIGSGPPYAKVGSSLVRYSYTTLRAWMSAHSKDPSDAI